MAPLARLPGLRRAAFTGSAMPACIGQLTGLERLTSSDAYENVGNRSDDIAVLAAALPCLTRLTWLGLTEAHGGEAAAVRLALPLMPQLRGLAWDLHSDDSAPLPTGPWLGRLQQLHAPACALGASLPALEAATSLEHLTIDDAIVEDYGLYYSSEDEEKYEEDAMVECLPAVLQWAARLPRLETIEMDPCAKEACAATLAEAGSALYGLHERLVWSKEVLPYDEPLERLCVGPRVFDS